MSDFVNWLLVKPNGSFESIEIPVFSNDNYSSLKIHKYIQTKTNLNSSIGPFGKYNKMIMYYGYFDNESVNNFAQELIGNLKCCCSYICEHEIRGNILISNYRNEIPIDCNFNDFLEMYYYETLPWYMPIWFSKWWYSI